MKTLSLVYSAGVLQSSTERIEPGLSVDRPTIPANGTTFAAVHWAGVGASVAVMVNGVTQTLPAVVDATSGLRVLELEITAAVAGPVEITVGTDTLTIQAA